MNDTDSDFTNRARHFTDGSFFGVDPTNPCGLQLSFSTIDTDRWMRVECETIIDIRFEGPPSHAHGGITSTILDEAMGACCFRNGFACLSVSMQTYWHEPVPLGEAVRIEANIERVENGRIHAASWIILPDGKRAVSATAAYLDRPAVFEKMMGDR